MSSNVTIEVDARHEGFVRRAMALAEELEQLALAAPDGEVFDACEAAVVHDGATSRPTFWPTGNDDPADTPAAARRPRGRDGPPDGSLLVPGLACGVVVARTAAARSYSLLYIARRPDCKPCILAER